MASEIIVEFPSPLTDKEKKMTYGYKGEVVRCKNCEHFTQLKCGDSLCYLDGRGCKADDYCSWAERKKDEVER